MTRETKRSAAAQQLVASLPKHVEPDVPLDSLVPFPGNPKDHDLGVIMESITRNGVADVIRAQAGTRYILGGHGTVEAMRALGLATADVLWLSCDAKTARRLVLVFNRAGEAGGFHLPRLVDFLTVDALAGNLVGTGYDGEAVDDFRTLLNGGAAPPDSGTDREREADAVQAIVVRVRRVRDVEPATKAIQRLLARHPEWSGSVSVR